MKKLLPVSALALTLSACAPTPQGKLRQAVLDLTTTYNTTAPLALQALQGKFPGITPSETQAEAIRKASATTLTLLQPLVTQAEQNTPLTTADVAALAAAEAALMATFEQKD